MSEARKTVHDQVMEFRRAVANSRRSRKQTASGDRGQRFEVIARMNGKEFVTLGWAEDHTAGGLQSALAQPEFSDLRIKDRDPLQQRVRVLKRGTCEKCTAQFDAGKDRCSYCNNPFVVSQVSGPHPIEAFGPEKMVDGAFIWCGHCKGHVANLDDVHECLEAKAFEMMKADRLAAAHKVARGLGVEIDGDANAE